MNAVLVPDVRLEHVAIAARMKQKALSGWYIGSMETLRLYGAYADTHAVTNPHELAVRLLFTRDRMHHSVGWWRNADYECCWHLSISCWERVKLEVFAPGDTPTYVDIPEAEETYWGRLFFGDHARWVWHEPGGTDPRLSAEEARTNKHLAHLRLFIDHEPPHVPIFPVGEVYQLTRWVPGLTPEKVDR